MTEYSADKLSEDITGSNNNSAIKQENLKWRILNIETSFSNTGLSV